MHIHFCKVFCMLNSSFKQRCQFSFFINQFTSSYLGGNCSWLLSQGNLIFHFQHAQGICLPYQQDTIFLSLTSEELSVHLTTVMFSTEYSYHICKSNMAAYQKSCEKEDLERFHLCKKNVIKNQYYFNLIVNILRSGFLRQRKSSWSQQTPPGDTKKTLKK